MRCEIEIVNPLKYEGWDSLLRSIPTSSFFQSESWAKLLRDCYSYKPLYFSIMKKGSLLALIPVMEIKSPLTGKRGVSLPYADFCDPIIVDEIEFPEVMNQVLEYGRKAGWQCLEFRGGQNKMGPVTPYSTFYKHVLSLDCNEKELFANFKSATRRNIRKAAKSGVKVDILTSLKGVREFYKLNCVTKKRQGIPAQSFRFFRKIHEHIISENRGFVALASYNNEYIAGAVCFHFNKQGIYNYGASDKSHQHLRANNLLMWEIIKWYSNNGFESFCLGITDLDNDGLRRFKTGMAPMESELSYYKYDFKEAKFIQNDPTMTLWRRELFKKMPVSFLKLTGAILYKHYG